MHPPAPQNRRNGEDASLSERQREERKREAALKRERKDSGSRGEHRSSDAKKYVRIAVLLFPRTVVLKMGKKSLAHPYLMTLLNPLTLSAVHFIFR